MSTRTCSTREAVERLRELAAPPAADDESAPASLPAPVRVRRAARAGDRARSPRSWPGSRPRWRSTRATGRCPIARCRSSRRTSRTPERRAALEEARNARPGGAAQPAAPRGARARRTSCAASSAGRATRPPTPSFAAIDLEALARQTGAFLEATEDAYAAIVDPQLGRAGLPPLGELPPLRTCRASFAPRTSTRCSRPTGWSPRSPTRSPGSASTCARRPTSTSTPSRGRRSPRAPSARPPAFPTRSTS